MLQADDVLGVVESVKAASDVYTPISGTVVEVNEELSAHPEKLNEDPYESWIAVLEPDDPSKIEELMDDAEYEKFWQRRPKMSDYIPNTEAQQQEMLADIGMTKTEDLFADIPQKVRLKRKLDIPKQCLKWNCRHICVRWRHETGIPMSTPVFLEREHTITTFRMYSKPAVKAGVLYSLYALSARNKPGTLQAIFEYQTMICSLTGMDVANASMYDGASALAEVASMACQTTGRHEILVAASAHPESRQVLSSYSRFSGNKVTELCYQDGRLDMVSLDEKLSANTSAVILQIPNFFVIIEDVKEIAEMAHRKGALCIVSCDPISLAILKSPGELGADIAVGEGQPLGNPLSFGGPYLGFFAARKKFLRRMPGRIVGETVDKNERRAFVLTVQTRNNISEGKRRLQTSARTSLKCSCRQPFI